MKLFSAWKLHDLFKLSCTKDLVLMFEIRTFSARERHSENNDFSVFFPRIYKHFMYFTSTTKPNPRFDMLCISLKIFYISFFISVFFPLSLLLHLSLVGRILRMQLRHFYIVATSRIITRGIYIWALSSTCKQVQLREYARCIFRLEVRLAQRRDASFPIVSFFARVWRRG